MDVDVIMWSKDTAQTQSTLSLMQVPVSAEADAASVESRSSTKGRGVTSSMIRVVAVRHLFAASGRDAIFSMPCITHVPALSCRRCITQCTR